MTIAVNWPAGTITIERSDLTSLSGDRYELDIDDFRLALRALEDSEDGVAWPPTHWHNTSYLISGTTYARAVGFAPQPSIGFAGGYSIEFEDGIYQVRLVGANTDLIDVLVVNSVSVIPTNAAGLIVVTTGSGVLPSDVTAIAAATRATILSDDTPFAGSNIDAKVSEVGGGTGGLTVEQAAQLSTAATNADVKTSTLAGQGLTTQQATWLDRIATLVGVPGQPEYVNTSSGTIGTGGTLTTLTRLGATLWKTVVTRHAGTAAEEATVTPEDVP